MSTTYRSAYYEVVHEPERGLVRLIRTAEPFASTDEMNRIHRELAGVFRKLGGEKLILDMRSGPARNDEAYERATQKSRLELEQFFKRIAVLVRTAAGKLQIQRLTREDGRGTPHVFHDEAAALRFLDGESP